MALDTHTFKTRTLTAIIFAAVMLAGLFINAYSFIALFLLVMVGALVELASLIRKIFPDRFSYYFPLALVYIVLPILMMIDIGTQHSLFIAGATLQYSALLPCAIIFSIWINDTMAYIVGSMIGKTPFSKISPKKTWEGTAGGAVLCVAVIALLGAIVPAAQSLPVIHYVIIAAICAVFGTLGDLLESKLKRMANVKDSGKLMPGHGGFLDRFDSLLIATPVVWIYLKLFLPAMA